jgi:hypothetical protein
MEQVLLWKWGSSYEGGIRVNPLSRIIVLVIFGLWLVGIFYLSSLMVPARGWGKQKSPLPRASPSSHPSQEMDIGRQSRWK